MIKYFFSKYIYIKSFRIVLNKHITNLEVGFFCCEYKILENFSQFKSIYDFESVIQSLLFISYPR